jgi:hypothetical protein
LTAALGDSRNAFLYEIVSVLLKLFTSSSDVYAGSAYADTKKNVRIIEPHCSIYGTTTPGNFFESLTAESVTDGFYARLLIFEGVQSKPNHDQEERPVPQAIIDEAQFWRDLKPGGNLSDRTPQPLILPYAPTATQLINNFTDYAEDERRRLGDPYGLLWPRAGEKARKLAILHHCSEHRVEGEISDAAAQWAIDLVSHLTRRLVFLATRWASSSAYDAKVRKLLRLIEAEGPNVSGGSWLVQFVWVVGRNCRELMAGGG